MYHQNQPSSKVQISGKKTIILFSSMSASKMENNREIREKSGIMRKKRKVREFEEKEESQGILTGSLNLKVFPPLRFKLMLSVSFKMLY